MKKYFKAIMLSSLVLVCSFSACNQTSGFANGELFVELDNNQVERFDCVQVGLEKGVNDVVWASSNENVAIVEDGKILALNAGTTVVTATKGREKQTQTITVFDNGNKPTIDVEYLPIMRGNNYEMDTQAYFNGKELKGATFEYSVANTSVATVENDVLTGVAYGETTVTISLSWKNQTNIVSKEVPCAVTKNTAVYTDKAEYTLYTMPMVLDVPFATEMQVETKVYCDGEKVNGLTLHWTSDNEEIATVDENGKLYAVSYGETYVVGTCEYNDETLSTRKVPVKVAKPHVETTLDFPFVKGDKTAKFDERKALGEGYTIGKAVNAATGTVYEYTELGADLSSFSVGEHRFVIYEENEAFTTSVNVVIADYVVTDVESLTEATKAQGAYVALAHDIDVGAFTTYRNKNHYSTGTFNGLGHTITAIFNSQQRGLYSYVGDFVFKNLSVVCTLNGNSQGALFYYCAGNITVENCYIEATMGKDTTTSSGGLGDYFKKASTLTLTNTIVKVNGLTRNATVQKECGAILARAGSTGVYYNNSYVIADGTLCSNLSTSAKVDKLNQQKGVLYKTDEDFAFAKQIGDIVLEGYNHYWDMNGSIPKFKNEGM